MPRILAAACLCMAGLVPSHVLALGLGEIDLKSALNQPFIAEIPISSESSDDVSRVEIRLASQETFARYGLDRAAFLTDLEFSIGGVPGNNVVLITSREPVTEPFVTLLLEITWPQGRLLREYTVLLDPPVFAAPGPSVGTEAAPQRTPAPVAQPEPEAPAAAQTSQPARSVAPRPTVASPQIDVAETQYGPVQRNETLWGISQRLRPDPSMGINQVMVAIYRANPDAFEGNINLLKRGAILRIPGRDEVSGIGASEASSEVRRQNEAWSAGAPEPETPSAAGRLQLVPPQEADAEPPTERPETTQGDGRGSAADASEQRRIADLENELADSQRLIELREQELKALQDRIRMLEGDQAADIDSETVAPEAAAPEPVVPDEEADIIDAPEEPEAEAVSPPVTPPAATTGAATSAPEQPSLIGSLLSNIWLYVGIALAALAALFLVRRRRSAGESTDRWDSTGAVAPEISPAEQDATQNLRALQPEEDTFVVEEEISEGTDIIEPDAPGTIPLSGDTATVVVDDEELPLERTISADSAVNLDEADPVAEADFHMAYGLYDQAADILVSAKEASPDRQDLRLKLLEVYFVWENKDAFLAEAQALREMIGDESDQGWNKVLIMGKQVCPDEPLFAGAPTAADDIDLSIGDVDGELDFALGDEGEPGGLDLDLAADDDDAGLDLDIGEGFHDDADASTLIDRGENQSPTLETPTIETEGPGADTMETPTLETEGPGAITMETPTIETPMASDSTMETPTIETPVSISTDQTAEIELDDLGLDLEGLDEVADALTDDDSDDAENLMATDLGDFSDVLDDDAPASDSTAAIDVDDELIDLGVDSTAEMQGFGAEEDPSDLSGLTEALEKSTPPDLSGDTAEQPSVGDTVEQPGGEAVLVADEVDLELDPDHDAAEDALTGTVDVSRGPEGLGGPDGPTMTEVGTKLDLARAYVDMGDPDGARSILTEVLEEGVESQRQEAQKLLDDLGD